MAGKWVREMGLDWEGERGPLPLHHPTLCRCGWCLAHIPLALTLQSMLVGVAVSMGGSLHRRAGWECQGIHELGAAFSHNGLEDTYPAYLPPKVG